MNSHGRNEDSDSISRFREFHAAVDSLVGTTGRFLRMPTDDKKPPAWIIAYDNVPEPGSTTAFTFGISSVPHDTWKLGRPEIVISLDSDDDDWILSLGAVSAGLRGNCPFSLGNVLRFGKPLSRQSAMSAFFLFWPTILLEEQQQLQLSDRKINFVQAYPIFDTEADVIATIGPERFFMTDGLEFSDVNRRPYGWGRNV